MKHHRRISDLPPNARNTQMFRGLQRAKWPKPFFCLSLSLSLRTSTVVANLQTMCRCLSVSWPWWLQGSLHLDFVGRCFGGQSSPISGAPHSHHTPPPINNEVLGMDTEKCSKKERGEASIQHTHTQSMYKSNTRSWVMLSGLPWTDTGAVTC